MSKASEWASNPRSPEPGLILRGAGFEAAPVLFPSGLSCSVRSDQWGHILLTRGQAMSLAQWILDTFGDGA